MLKKRLIALMLVGVVSTATLTGCGAESSKTESEVLQKSNYGGVKDAYIILEQNDKDILHKGSMGVLFTDGYNAGGPNTDYNYKFNCGEETISNGKHQIYSVKPKAECYDEK